jgi:hypothetical protein
MVRVEGTVLITKQTAAYLERGAGFAPSREEQEGFDTKTAKMKVETEGSVVAVVVVQTIWELAVVVDIPEAVVVIVVLIMAAAAAAALTMLVQVKSTKAESTKVTEV